MKMNRSQLKSLIKECLVEILNEGLGGAVASSPVAVSSPRQPQASSARHQVMDSRVQPRGVTEGRAAVSSNLKQVVKQVAEGNSVMESILADTAATTYQTFVANDRPGAFAPQGYADAHALQVATSTPEQLFGEEAAAGWNAIMDRFVVE